MMSKSRDSVCQPNSQDERYKMGGAADRKELGETLDNRQDDDLHNGHKRSG